MGWGVVQFKPVARRAAEVDDRTLLEKYVEHVRQCEGIDFIDRINEHPAMSSDVVFTEPEVARLKSLERP